LVLRYSRVVLGCGVRLQTLVVEGTQCSNDFSFLKTTALLEGKIKYTGKRKSKPPWDGKSGNDSPQF
jgi:hypothetical protein